METGDLRSRAERVLAQRGGWGDSVDTLALRHELDVYQVELQLQNEQLQAAQGELLLAAVVFAHCYDAILVCNADGCIVDVNAAFTRLTGVDRDVALGRRPQAMAAFGTGCDDLTRGMGLARSLGHWRGEINTEAGTLLVSLARVADPSLSGEHVVGVLSDISHLHNHAAELDRMAHYDALTGLPNRRLFADRLGQAMARARRSGHPLAVCYLDLDGFKAINDQHGHAFGDQFLVGVTRHLSTVLRGEDTLSRLGGDEFVLLLGLSGPHDYDAALARVMSAVTQPIALGGEQVQITASIGVTLFPSDDADADTLLRHADQAMYQAKEQGKNRVQLFDVQQARHQQARRDQLARLRQALVEQEFVLHYQPKVDLQDGHIVGVEALLRWQHPELGMQPPLSFLQAMENTELEKQVGEWVLGTALAQVAAWAQQSLQLVASVNISPNHLMRPEFVERLRALLAEHPGAAPGLLELEILESATVTDLARAAHTVSECRDLGVNVSLDDFGTGHSALALLRHLPVGGLKIDQSFVRDMRRNANDHALVDAVIRLGEAFGRDVTAEGVETLEDAAALRALGCRYGQGYGFARPMPAAQLPTWLAAWEASATWPPLAQFSSDS